MTMIYKYCYKLNKQYMAIIEWNKNRFKRKNYSIKNLSGMHNMKSDKIAAVFLILILMFGGVVLCLQYM